MGDDDEVAHAHGGDQGLPIAADVAALSVHRDHIAHFAGLRQLRNRAPGADIALAAERTGVID